MAAGKISGSVKVVTAMHGDGHFVLANLVGMRVFEVSRGRDLEFNGGEISKTNGASNLASDETLISHGTSDLAESVAQVRSAQRAGWHAVLRLGIPARGPDWHAVQRQPGPLHLRRFGRRRYW